MIKYTDLLNEMFATKIDVKIENNIFTASHTYTTDNNETFEILGIADGVMLDNKMSLVMADHILDLPNTANLILAIDTGGQQATHQAELLGLNRYFAHLIKVIHFKRQQGLRVFAIVFGRALGGAFIATALNAEKIYATPDAQISVMWLEAMSKITKIPLAKLQELSLTSPIFAPGAENFYKLGAVEEILPPYMLMPRIMADMKEESTLNDWRNHGLERGGREIAAKIISEVLDA